MCLQLRVEKIDARPCVVLAADRMVAALRRRRASIALLALVALVALLTVAASHDVAHEGEVTTSHCTACVVAHTPSLGAGSIAIAHELRSCGRWMPCERVAFVDLRIVRSEPSRGPPSRV